MYRKVQMQTQNQLKGRLTSCSSGTAKEPSCLDWRDIFPKRWRQTSEVSKEERRGEAKQQEQREGSEGEWQAAGRVKTTAVKKEGCWGEKGMEKVRSEEEKSEERLGASVTEH